MADTDRDWEYWGKNDPYYGVLTFDKYRGDKIEDHLEEFFTSGEQNIGKVLDRHERYFGPLKRGSALDFGCGVGRLTLALGQKFDKAVGLDISSSMLAEAEKNKAARGAGNVDFRLSDDTLSRVPEQFDFVYSHIVLQHINADRGMDIIRQLIARVAPDGGCSLHMSVKRSMSLKRRLVYWVRFNLPGGQAVMKAITGRPGMQMSEYPIVDVMQLFYRAGMVDLTVEVDDHEDVMTVAIGGRRKA